MLQSAGAVTVINQDNSEHVMDVLVGQGDPDVTSYKLEVGMRIMRICINGCGPSVSADLHRYILQGGSRQTLHNQDADHLSRSTQRSGVAVL